ncbi:TIGR00282 family metallophosphoesterase [Maridesulfovibrio sp.]|uniref:TIGR00282 family metallophosphoesterase n=1 Tax=Maridesulfovibrio sp. TaxID=2795000 RepID=UPI002A18E67E|nr:TIGR00282 family metallophosphoesterase [Maridesulfovibrio sp.]
MRILFLGDIVGRPGRKGVALRIGELRRSLKLDLVIANGENASQGIGLSAKNAADLLGCGIDVITSGNHIWKYQNLYPLLKTSERIVRPANVPEDAPGKGWTVFRVRDEVPVAILNMQGRTFMNPAECPFRCTDRLLEGLDPDIKIVLLDFHAEATSEKQCFGRYLDGRVSAVFGTHTHVQTNDARIFENGTGFITDAGMCGPVDSCLGLTPKPVIKRFVSGLPQKWKVAGGPVELQGALLEVDEHSGRTVAIEAWKSGLLDV